MPPIKRPRELLAYFTREELEANYVRAYVSLGYKLEDAIATAKAAVQRKFS